MTDPIRIIRELDVLAIRARLDELDRERAALLVLLRAARRATPGEVPAPKRPSVSPSLITGGRA